MTEGMTLEPCPFCGMAVEYVTRPVSYGREFWYVYHPEHPHGECILEDRKFSSAHGWNNRAHLSQPAQAVDVGAIRTQLLRIAADNQQSALTLGQEGLRGQCIETSKELHKLTRALSGEKARRVDGWQPIENAPKDGTHVVLYFDGNYPYECSAYWDDVGGLADWYCMFTGQTFAETHSEAIGKPIAWRIPAPPTPDKEG